MKRFKDGDLVVIIESGKIGVIDAAHDSLPCDYHVQFKNYDHWYDDNEVRPATKLDRLLLGLDKSDNAVHNKTKVKT